MPNPGKMDVRIYLQTKVTTPDNAGGWTETWADGQALWADAYQTGMQERAWASNIGVRAEWTVRLHYTRVTRALRVGDRLRLGEHRLRITDVKNRYQDSREIRLLCEELGTATVDR